MKVSSDLQKYDSVDTYDSPSKPVSSCLQYNRCHLHSKQSLGSITFFEGVHRFTKKYDALLAYNVIEAMYTLGSMVSVFTILKAFWLKYHLRVVKKEWLLKYLS